MKPSTIIPNDDVCSKRVVVPPKVIFTRVKRIDDDTMISPIRSPVCVPRARNNPRSKEVVNNKEETRQTNRIEVSILLNQRRSTANPHVFRLAAVRPDLPRTPAPPNEFECSCQFHCRVHPCSNDAVPPVDRLGNKKRKTTPKPEPDSSHFSSTSSGHKKRQGYEFHYEYHYEYNNISNNSNNTTIITTNITTNTATNTTTPSYDMR